jgi:hypothetical protein
MPITPLHYGVFEPVNYAFPRKVSVVSFTLVTVWIDIGSISNVLTGTQLEAHGYKPVLGKAEHISNDIGAIKAGISLPTFKQTLKLINVA